MISPTSPATDLIESLPGRLQQVRAFTFVYYQPYPGVVPRLRRPGTTAASSENAPWVRGQKVLDQLAQSDDVEKEVQAMLLHDSAPEHSSQVEVAADDVRRGWARHAVLPDGTTLGLASIVHLEDGSYGHIPLMDFACPVSEKNLEIVSTGLRLLGQHEGAILDSGRSYHSYGFSVMTEPDWRDFMVRALFLDPFVDTRYVAHRLLSRRAVLRVTAHPVKKQEPHVVRVLTG